MPGRSPLSPEQEARARAAAVGAALMDFAAAPAGETRAADASGGGGRRDTGARPGPGAGAGGERGAAAPGGPGGAGARGAAGAERAAGAAGTTGAAATEARETPPPEPMTLEESARGRLMLQEEDRLRAISRLHLTDERLDREWPVVLASLKAKFKAKLTEKYPTRPEAEKDTLAGRLAQEDLGSLKQFFQGGAQRDRIERANKFKAVRDRYVRAKKALEEYQGVVGKFRGFIRGDKKSEAEHEFDAAKQAYEAERATLIGEHIETLAEEQMHVIDTMVERVGVTREGKRFMQPIRKAWDWLGNLNLNTLHKKVYGREAKAGVVRFAGKVLSVRTAIMSGLAFGGLFFKGAVGTAALALRASGASLGGTFFSHDVLDAWARRQGPRDRLQGLSLEKVRMLTYDEAIDLLGSIQVDAQLRGYKVSEIPNYLELQKHFLALENANKIELSLTERLEELEKREKQLEKKSKRDAVIRKGYAVALGAAWGSFILARGLLAGQEKELGEKFAQYRADEAALEAKEKAAAAAAAKAEAAAEKLTAEAFGQEHSLLRDQGFNIEVGADGKVHVWTEVGDKGQFKYIQYALQRLVIQETEAAKLHGGTVVDALDMGRMDNSVANLTQLLEAKQHVIGLTPEQLKGLGITYEQVRPGVLKLDIQDYQGGFAKLMEEKILKHAEELIHEKSNALAYGDNHSHSTMQELWDQKMHAAPGRHLIEVKDLNHDPLVQAAERQVFTEHVQGLGMGEEIKLLEITNESQGRFVVEGFTVEVDDDIVAKVIGPAGEVVVSENAAAEAKMSIQNSVSGGWVRNALEVWKGAHPDAEALAAQLLRHNTELIKALQLPSGASTEMWDANTFKVQFPDGQMFCDIDDGKLVRIGGHRLEQAVDLSDTGAASEALRQPYSLHDLFRTKGWGIQNADGTATVAGKNIELADLTRVASEGIEKFLHRYHDTGLHRLGDVLTFDDSKQELIRGYEHLARVIASNPDPQATTVGEYLIHHALKLGELKIRPEVLIQAQEGEFASLG